MAGMNDRNAYPRHSAVDVLTAWDAVQARRPRPGAWAMMRARWRAAPLHTALIAILLGGAVLPWLILIGGIALLALWDRLTGG